MKAFRSDIRRPVSLFTVGLMASVLTASVTMAQAQSKSAVKRSTATNRGGYNRAMQPANARVTAQVGRVIVVQSPIRVRPSNGAATLFDAPQETEVAVVTDNGLYFGVLMANRTVAWIKKADIELLDFDVEMPYPTNAPVEDDNPPPIGPNDGDSLNAPDMSALTGDLDAFRRTLFQEAASYKGAPYSWGGMSHAGIDCSGFVLRVFEKVGVKLPRVSSSQAMVGQAVSFDQLQSGDRLYFDCNPNRPGVDHTGIYVGGGYFIHSSQGRGVAVQKLDIAYWRNHFVVGRRDF